MTTATRPLADGFGVYSPPQQLDGPIVVATDLSAQSDAAFPTAMALAARTNQPVHVVSAIMPVAMPMYAFDVMSPPVGTDDVSREGRESEVRAQSARLSTADSAWPIAVKVGEPAHVIVEFARSLHASVIVVGRGRHAALKRALGGETVLRLLQLGDIPVLATEARTTGLPARVVIATDFSEFSLRAAQVGLSLVAPDAHVYFVHVMPMISDADTGLQERAAAYRSQAAHAFSQWRERLARDGMQFEDVLAEGDTAEELVKVVHAKDADLVVTATHGYGFLRRMILGSVAAELVRHAPCSVLCVPGSAHTLRTARARSTTRMVKHQFDVADLDAELRAFSDRNAGRPCAIELDDADLGAQVIGHSLPLVGATHDHSTGIASLMFGSSAFTGAHLTHSIPGVSGMDVQVDAEGRDQVLRLSHARGQTLVLLE
jgi:nucleotide-binding universal stress UspA family protein